MLYNVHERVIDAPVDRVWALIERLGGPEDVLWPAPRWAPMRLSGRLAVGVSGGHGSVRYRVAELVPGRRVRLAFEPITGIDGYHEFTVTDEGARQCRLTHVLWGRPRGVMRALVPLFVEALHDQVVEDLLDNAEREAAGVVRPAARMSPWVWLWWALGESAEKRRGERWAHAEGVVKLGSDRR